MASRREAKLLHFHIFAARAFQAILTVECVLDHYFEPKDTLVTAETKSKVVSQSSSEHPFVHPLSSSSASLAPWRVSC